jgi:hypothetical protein
MLVLITPGANGTEVASYGTKVPYPATAPERLKKGGSSDAFEGQSLVNGKKSQFQPG